MGKGYPFKFLVTQSSTFLLDSVYPIFVIRTLWTTPAPCSWTVWTICLFTNEFVQRREKAICSNFWLPSLPLFIGFSVSDFCNQDSVDYASSLFLDSLNNLPLYKWICPEKGKGYPFKFLVTQSSTFLLDSVYLIFVIRTLWTTPAPCSWTVWTICLFTNEFVQRREKVIRSNFWLPSLPLIYLIQCIRFL